MKQVLLAVALAIAVGTASAQVADQNSWSFMVRRNGNCANTYASIIESKYFANNATCKAAVKQALETFSKASCPDTKAGTSLVWNCMSGWNGTTTNQALINDWTAFLTGCELLYIAQRANTAESEDGFKWIDNSCFGRFVNMGQFVSYLRDASTTSGGSGGSAETTILSFYNIMLAIVAAVLMAWL